MADTLDPETMRRRLLDERDALAEGDAMRREGSATVELDQTRTGRLSRMDALQGQAMAQAVSARAQERLQRIAAALRRLDAGDYGYCLECEEPIDIRRLGADPATSLCLGCAAARER
ncbi:TraR/DksA family transcriptional regulator [Aquisalimonas lutea]|uniref:TraR/DksA family transcriptional regulator n=1 Tax=Aquisalimonas lutea TaxID=1327750 RepID=UPI0025B29486|nr:TraR/DksA family transcriptional regulator [Aquisalimonas lutea]MDN3518926.1 TraR/DksA family transcriptional regulator [Aquisalimonas lutea]